MGGGDKCLVQLAGRPLLAHALDRIRPQAAQILLNANGDANRFSAFGLSVAPDPIEGGLGPLAGILAGMRWARDLGYDQVISLPTDTPFFPMDLVRRLASASTAKPVACAESAGSPHPVFAIWPVAVADALEHALRSGQRKVGRLMEQVGCDHVAWPADPFDPFFNINTPADLVEAEELVLAHGLGPSLEYR
jgi:molybdopterin-guanine dinucleotide biosynthesis protein A